MSLPVGIYYGLPVNRALSLGGIAYGAPLYRTLWYAVGDAAEIHIETVAYADLVKARFTVREITDISCVCRHDLTTAVRVAYAYDYARREVTKALLLEAVEPLRDYGRVETELRCLWLTTPRAALKVGTAWLARKARPLWEISFTVGIEYAGLNPGNWVGLHHPYLPVSGPALCLEVTPDYDRAEVRITTEMNAGPLPNIRLVTLSAAYDPQTLPGVTVQFSAGQVNLSFKDDSGKPLSGATVTLDNTTRRTTDSAGNVIFDGVAHGAHLVTISAPGYPGIEQQITV